MIDYRQHGRPVFIHAMWRTGSTYIWNKFRENRRYRAYYEPLHEIFIDATSQKLKEAWSDETAFVMRHPHLESAYFTEYEDLIRIGHARFERSFPYRRYCLEEAENEEPLRHYIAELLIFALANGQTPVLQFNRSLLRTGWLTAHFDPVNILLLRRPIDVWKSFISFENRYFPTVLCMATGQDRRHPMLKDLAGRHGVPFFEGPTWEAEYDFYHEYASASLDRLYPLFYEFYLLTSVYAVRYADCVIDLNEVSESDTSRKQVTERLRSLGIDISLEDCHLPRYTDLTDADQARVAYEAGGRKRLRSSLPPRLCIPRERFEMHRSSIGQDVQRIFGEFLGETAERLEIQRPSADERYRLGLKCFENGHAREASVRFRDAVLEQPTSQHWNDWAAAEAACGHTNRAEAGFRRALALEPGDGQAMVNLGALLAGVGREREAIPLLRESASRVDEPHRAVIKRLLANCCEKVASKARFEAQAAVREAAAEAPHRGVPVRRATATVTGTVATGGSPAPNGGTPKLLACLGKYALARGPQALTLESSSVCNLRCVMCPQGRGLVHRPRHFPKELVNKLGPYLPGIVFVQLHGIGEPLHSPAFWRFLETLSTPEGAHIEVNSNMTVLTDDQIGKLLGSRLQLINVSLDAATPETYAKIRGYDFNRVIGNLKRFISRRNAEGYAKPAVFLNMTLMRENIEELGRFVELGHSLGVDGLQFWHMNSGDDYRLTKKDGWTFDYQQQKLSNYPQLSNKRIRSAIALAQGLGTPIKLDPSKTLFFEEAA